MLAYAGCITIANVLYIESLQHHRSIGRVSRQCGKTQVTSTNRLISKPTCLKGPKWPVIVLKLFAPLFVCQKVQGNDKIAIGRAPQEEESMIMCLMPDSSII